MNKCCGHFFRSRAADEDICQPYGPHSMLQKVTLFSAALDEGEVKIGPCNGKHETGNAAATANIDDAKQKRMAMRLIRQLLRCG